MKPKIMREASPKKSNGYDQCGTPGYALEPLLPFLHGTIWEPASGEGLIVDYLSKNGLQVFGTDLLAGIDFHTNMPDQHFDMLITNPPYSDKYRWIARCYEIGKPWALLMPVETIGAASSQIYFEKYGVEIMYLNKRVNFKMPNKGWQGSAAQFPVCWYSWKMTGQERIFAKIFPPKKQKQIG